jgi:type IV secretory pathway component VirB8
VVNILSSLETQYRFEKIENEENYSIFEVFSTNEVFQRVRDMVEQNNGTAITIQYGTY